MKMIDSLFDEYAAENSLSDRVMLTDHEILALAWGLKKSLQMLWERHPTLRLEIEGFQKELEEEAK